MVASFKSSTLGNSNFVTTYNLSNEVGKHSFRLKNLHYIQNLKYFFSTLGMISMAELSYTQVKKKQNAIVRNFILPFLLKCLYLC